MKQKPKGKLLANITFKDGRKRIVINYVRTNVLDGMVWVVSESGEGFICPRDTVETIEIRRSLL